MKRWCASTDLSEPSVNGAEVIIVICRAFGQFGDLSLVEVLLSLVLAHLTNNGFFLKSLRPRK